MRKNRGLRKIGVKYISELKAKLETILEISEQCEEDKRASSRDSTRYKFRGARG